MLRRDNYEEEMTRTSNHNANSIPRDDWSASVCVCVCVRVRVRVCVCVQSPAIYPLKVKAASGWCLVLSRQA